MASAGLEASLGDQIRAEQDIRMMKVQR